MRCSWPTQTDVPANGSGFEANTRNCPGQESGRNQAWSRVAAMVAVRGPAAQELLGGKRWSQVHRFVALRTLKPPA
jgi:hypothetical protein